MTQSQEERNNFLRQRQEYTNDAITAFVENTVTDERITEVSGRVIQHIYPIYKPPVTSKRTMFSTHFFSSYKLLWGWQVDTLWANLIMIWIFTLVLYGLLYINFLRVVVRFRYQDVFVTVARRQAMVWRQRLFSDREKA